MGKDSAVGRVKRRKLNEYCSEFLPETPILTMDGFDEAIIGVCCRNGQEPIVAYDKNIVIRMLVDSGMDKDEAEEFFDFNQMGAWMGEGTPCFITFL